MKRRVFSRQEIERAFNYGILTKSDEPFDDYEVIISSRNKIFIRSDYSYRENIGVAVINPRGVARGSVKIVIK